jgi:signal transduction histidine kinase
MKVLVADDSLIMRRLLQASLQRWDYEVALAEDGNQAWLMFQKEPFSLVLTDWMMPEMDGLELIRRIRSFQAPGYVYIILLTAKAEKQDLVEGMEVGADDFLSKPVNQDELRVRVREGERIINLERALAEQNRKLRETQAALVQSEKLASLGQLAAGMAHEINNPIAYVANNLAVIKRETLPVLELLEKYRKGQPALAQAKPELAAQIATLEGDCDLPWIAENLPRLLRSSLDGLGRVREIVSNLRDFARLDEAELDELDLNAALRSTVKILRYAIDEKQLEVECQLEPVPKALCHPKKINQALYNVLLNAIQASRPQGRLWLRTRSEGQSVAIEVQDEGAGIDPVHLPRIFEPFFTTRPVGQGAGLGLAITYGIVRDHGGTIDVQSDLGKGSLFRVLLPLRPPKADSP